jgi:hypothetical protein
MPDFLPRRMDEMLQWSRNFDQVLSVDYQAYEIPQSDAQKYSELHQAYVDAFRMAADRGTNSDTAEFMRRQTLKTLKDFARVLSRHVAGRMDVTDAQRRILGISERRKKPTKPRLPDPPPNVLIEHSAGRTVTIRLRDPDAPASRGMPKTAALAWIYTFVGEQPPLSAKGWRVEWISKATFHYTFDPKIPAGAKVWFSARWAPRAGKPGMGSAPVCTHVGFAEIAMAA